jgi:hypothetical protein
MWASKQASYVLCTACGDGKLEGDQALGRVRNGLVAAVVRCSENCQPAVSKRENKGRVQGVVQRWNSGCGRGS